MNTLNYIGCKHTLFKNISYVLHENIHNLKEYNFLDIFAGTGVVGFNMLNYCKSVSANDLEYYSFVINKGLLNCSYSEKIRDIINGCNSLNKKVGLITLNFSPGEQCERMFFTPENAEKADSIRMYIQELYEKEFIDINEYYFLLGSLLVSIDKVANTTSVYGAYLKKFKPASLKPLIMKPIHEKVYSIGLNVVYNKKAEDFIDENYDIVYMDPPYNNRQYSSNYSPLNYIALYNKDVLIKGKTGLMDGYNRSLFCVKNKVVDTFRKMVKDLKCKYILLSYNNEGIISFEEIKAILLEKGDVILYKIKYKKYKSSNKSSLNDSVYEYLWFTKVDVSDSLRFYEEREIE